MASKRSANVEVHRLAHYAFFAGLLVSLGAAFFRTYLEPVTLVTTLVILGIIVGAFNLTAKETMPFLVAR